MSNSVIINAGTHTGSIPGSANCGPCCCYKCAGVLYNATGPGGDCYYAYGAVFDIDTTWYTSNQIFRLAGQLNKVYTLQTTIDTCDITSFDTPSGPSASMTISYQTGFSSGGYTPGTYGLGTPCPYGPGNGYWAILSARANSYDPVNGLAQWAIDTGYHGVPSTGAGDVGNFYWVPGNCEGFSVSGYSNEHGPMTGSMTLTNNGVCSDLDSYEPP